MVENRYMYPNKKKKKQKKNLHNIFTTLSQQVLVLGCYEFLLVGQKSYFSGRFKVEPIKNRHI